MNNRELLLEVKDLVINYGAITAVKGISLKVNKGEIVALIGSNGAGKTSLLRAISGIVLPKEGNIIFKGQQISGLVPEKITRLGLSQSPEGRQTFPDLTVLENLMIGGFVIKSKEQLNENLKMVYSFFPRLKERENQLAVTLSGGEQQMLAIGRALMSNPELLLLDEPSLGLAPIIVKNILEIISEIAKKGTTVLIVEQNAVQTLKIADYTYVLETGKITNHGKSSELIHDESLIESYLGKKK